MRVGWPDEFIEHGKVDDLRAKYGLTAEGGSRASETLPGGAGGAADGGALGCAAGLNLGAKQLFRAAMAEGEGGADLAADGEPISERPQGSQRRFVVEVVAESRVPAMPLRVSAETR